jgi:hypothetical protein
MSHHLESKQKPMKAKHLSLALATLLAAGGLWLARGTWRAHRQRVTLEIPKAAPAGAGLKNGRPKPGPMPHPPNPNQRFTDFTPEQRVQFARQGHGPGG